MNFEELLETRDVRKTTKLRLPYGFFYKRLIDGRYSNFVEFHDEVADHVAFSHCVRSEAEAMSKFGNKHQLHFTPNEGEDGVYAIAVEVGNFVSFEQLLNENPSIVAQKDVLTHTVRDLCELTQQLNEQEVYHVCFAPSNVLVSLCYSGKYTKPQMLQFLRGKSGLGKSETAMGLMKRGSALVVNLPGSEKAARENWAGIAGALPHAVSMMAGGGH